ncbi:MAG: FlgD immunoglobulin-like domain containing protein [Candidatus Eisenbacteria bacterium]
MEDQRLRIWYSARSVGEQWHVGYTEGPLADFEAANESPWEDVNGSVAATTELPRSGTHGLVEVGGPAAPQAFLAMESHESVSVWMFDDLGSEPDRRNILRVWDPGNPTYPLHAIGVGIDTGQSVDHYVIHTEGWIYSTTSVPRTYGWHLLSIRVRSTACDLLIDGQVVGTLTVLRESRVNRASIEGSTGGPGWFDDAYIRPFAWPEPSTSVGPATPASIDPEIVLRAVLDLQAPVPNPVRTSTRIGCSLPSPSHLRARIFAADGRLTRTLADGPRPAGRQEMIWNGCDQHGTPVPSGIYFVRIDAGGASRTRKLMVVR